MPYQIHSTPRLSSEPSSRSQSRVTSPRASTSGQRPHLPANNSAMSTIMKKLNGATEEYWSHPSPLYTPRASVDNSRAASVHAPTATTAAPVAAAAAAASPKKEKKAGVLNKVKRAIDRNTEEYWGNAEMSTFYAAGLKI